MRKEVSFAVIIGIILGGVILFGINLANQSTSNLPKEPTPSIITPTLASTKSSDEGGPTISISSFSNNDVVFETPYSLSGKANPNTKIAIISENDDILTETNSAGSFSAQINLTSGENKIKISQLEKDNSLTTITLTLYYSNKPIND